jgi:membrane protein
MKTWFRSAWAVLCETFAAMSADHVPTMSAALAYYTFFSIAPVVIVVIAVAGLVFGEEAAHGAVSRALEGVIGSASAVAVEDLVKSASGPRAGVVATVTGVVAILFGATGVFAELQESLNTIWKAPALRINKVFAFLRSRFLSFSVVLGVGFLLLVSLMVSVALTSVCNWMGKCDQTVGRLVEAAVSFAITALLFAFIFKLLPDLKVAWRHVWHGALLTAVLFTIGKWVLGLVLGHSSLLSAYGAAASLAALLLWVQYASLILLVGAELSHVIAARSGDEALRTVDAPWAEGQQSLPAKSKPNPV